MNDHDFPLTPEEEKKEIMYLMQDYKKCIDDTVSGKKMNGFKCEWIMESIRGPNIASNDRRRDYIRQREKQ